MAMFLCSLWGRLKALEDVLLHTKAGYCQDSGSDEIWSYCTYLFFGLCVIHVYHALGLCEGR